MPALFKFLSMLFFAIVLIFMIPFIFKLLCGLGSILGGVAAIVIIAFMFFLVLGLFK